MTFTSDATVRMDLGDPVHALSYIPYRFGFVPERSLVCLSVRRHEGRLVVGLAARIDLDDALDERAGPLLIRRILHEAKRERARHLITAVFDPGIFQVLTGDPDSAPETEIVRAEALAQLLGRLFDVSFEDPATLNPDGGGDRPCSIELTYLVGQDSWRCLACRHEPPCPPEGSPRTVLADSAMSAQMVFTGHQIAASREDLVVVPVASQAARDEAQRVGTAVMTTAARRDLAHHRNRVITEWARVLALPGDDIAQLGPARIGALAASLGDVQIRDAILLAMCTATPPTYSNSVDLKARIDSLFANRSRPLPEGGHGGMVLALMAGHCRGPLLAPILATWAWYKWWCGDGTAANVLLDRCLAIDPTHQLARLLNQLLHTNARPPWSEAA